MQGEDYPVEAFLATGPEDGLIQGKHRTDPEDPVFSIPPTLAGELRILMSFGIGKPLLGRMAALAARNGTSIEQELLASGAISETVYYEVLAERLDLPFAAEIDPATVHDAAWLDTQLVRPEILRCHHPVRPPRTWIVPTLARSAELAARMERLPELRASLGITTPTAIRRAVWKAGAARRLRETVGRLFERDRDISARIVLAGPQAFLIGFLAANLLICLALAPGEAQTILHLLLSVFYLSHLLLRLSALTSMSERARPSARPPARLEEEALPVYTVMVALYKEAAVCHQLVAALDQLDWPVSRLDIKLICEADDTETLEALRALSLGPAYEVVEMPPALPRTKPKALSFALAGARGEFLTVYDAEDRPHPQQLREAAATFRASPDRLACLQAPLVIANADAHWLSGNFALEYAGLFRRLLPMLAARGLPLPLGGTSNHFRTHTLREAGGWDPFNMTEDADLGLRLHRLGWRTGMISLPTLEDAPTSWRVWQPQRVRWFKGWLQTWLVMMRAPGRLWRDMGPGASLSVHIMISGMLFSALIHPLMLVFALSIPICYSLDPTFLSHPMSQLLAAIDLVNMAGSYAALLSLGFSPMGPRERRKVGSAWRWLPVYWLLISIAAWRAVGELYRRPFVWNKTPHMPTRAMQEPTAGE
ncbi:Glycosyltransferase, catalytic subunit of cellulose synthase and poly-beta-1,6-N-acetylglucosamine synthase [Rhizobium sp. RU20A]|uniref:glycosyltransferase family 2 protein n=1 Tax=Rhizobium sp. RU20A TaxID=1907412 RepID=UPI00095692C9|nr:glycosyltransferase [Rhizobium sp. RU20A]SIQ61768.1 Glycosyltransferase, catalytic subunit of cellulose synthase and poly-beta-1,6-N-acetylglucosamine synthase [Rhizobium sp. RU20A]